MTFNRRTILFAGAAAIVVPTVGRAAAIARVTIPEEKAAFEPDEVRIKVGDTVEWTNEGIVTHTVTCDPTKAVSQESVALPAGAQPFDSGDLTIDSVYKQVFTVPGTYRYFCIPHEDMKMIGTVIVSA